MSTERTFSIIKPDAVERNKIGEITAMLENAGLRSHHSNNLDLQKYLSLVSFSNSDKNSIRSL